MTRFEIANLLPGVYQRTLGRDGPLDALLAVMEDLHAPAEAALDRLDAAFDPRRTEDRFVPFLARWVDMDRLFNQPGGEQNTPAGARLLSGGLGRLRELTAAAAFLSQWRGTAVGLRRFLETATGERGFIIDEAVPGETGRPTPFHIRITAPAAAARQRALIQWIIDSEKPAYVTCELCFEEEDADPVDSDHHTEEG